MIAHDDKMQVYFELFANDVEQHYIQLIRKEGIPSLRNNGGRHSRGRAWQGVGECRKRRVSLRC